MTGGEQSPRDVLWRMTNGYQVSQAIHVAATLGIADLLADGPKAVEDLAASTVATPRTGTRRPTPRLASRVPPASDVPRRDINGPGRPP